MQNTRQILRCLLLCTVCINKPFDTFCQSDSTLIKGELTWIHSVPFAYNRKLNEKDSGSFDAEYSSIIKKGIRIVPALITVLPDTTKTWLINKCTGDYFTMGQLAYILIDNIERIPFFLVTGITADVLYGCSNLADGVLDYVRYNGVKFETMYKRYFYSKRQEKH